MSPTITVASRHASPEKLEKRFPGATILDVTSRGNEPWIRFSPFFPHGGIPIPFSPGATGASVEGIWQALKVFEKCDVDATKLSVTNMRGIKRSARMNGRVLGHRAGIEGTTLLSYLDARKQIYLPSYLWMLENCVSAEIETLRNIASEAPLVFLDYEKNCDVLDLSHPLSHAGLIKKYLENDWPQF